jgi:hypothetical protein
MRKMIDEIVDRSKDELVAATIQNIKDSLSDTCKSAVLDEVREVVCEKVRTEIVPLIAVQISERRDMYVEAGVKAADAIAAMMTEKLIEEAISNLSQSWNVRKIADALFK